MSKDREPYRHIFQNEEMLYYVKTGGDAGCFVLLISGIVRVCSVGETDSGKYRERSEEDGTTR